MEAIALFLGYIVLYLAAIVACILLVFLGAALVWKATLRLFGTKLTFEACAAYRKTNPEKFKSFDSLYNKYS